MQRLRDENTLNKKILRSINRQEASYDRFTD